MEKRATPLSLDGINLHVQTYTVVLRQMELELSFIGKNGVLWVKFLYSTTFLS